MSITGIICEYNPFHIGHKKQIDIIRNTDPDGSIVCLMSGNYVQRGAPAIFDKMVRAKAAVLSGADLVLELPITYALRSAEGFASGGVEILSKFCDSLCFGAEYANTEHLMEIAQAQLSDKFPAALKDQLSHGLSYPAACQAALTGLGIDGSPLSLPNNILAIEYCKAIISQKSPLNPHVILRQGGYHDITMDKNNPSATALRQEIMQNGDWKSYIPNAQCFDTARIHDIQYGERAIQYRLRTMTDGEFEALPYSSEGLWRKLMHASRECSTLEYIITMTKSKRYTRSRIDRMIMCAFLGITNQMLTAHAPYVRVLGLNDKGRNILKNARRTGSFLNIGETRVDPYQAVEDRCGSLYGLFAEKAEEPDAESEYRVFYNA